MPPYSRRVIGWALDRTKCWKMSCRWRRSVWLCPTGAVQPGVVHHSDRGSQYASNEYTDLLKASQIDISMSRKGKILGITRPVESFMENAEVRRGGFCATNTGIWREARASIRRISGKDLQPEAGWHSALGYLPPGRVRTKASRQQGGRCAATSSMSFLRHSEIYRPIWVSFWPSLGATTAAAPAHRLDEFPAGYSLAGRSPAEPASRFTSQVNQYALQSVLPVEDFFQRTANSVLTVCVSRGGKRMNHRIYRHRFHQIDINTQRIRTMDVLWCSRSTVHDERCLHERWIFLHLRRKVETAQTTMLGDPASWKLPSRRRYSIPSFAVATQ